MRLYHLGTRVYRLSTTNRLYDLLDLFHDLKCSCLGHLQLYDPFQIVISSNLFEVHHTTSKELWGSYHLQTRPQVVRLAVVVKVVLCLWFHPSVPVQ